jgi:predicted metal-dependent hydrolase
MGLITGGLALETLDRTAYMFWKDALLFSGRTWMSAGRFLFGQGGFLRGVGKEYRAWYRKDFHPDQIDDRDLLAIHTPIVAAEIAR